MNPVFWDTILKKKEITAYQQVLLEWYRHHQRHLPWRETRDPYKIWVSEVMLQQTQVETAIPYYHRFIKRFPDVRRLAVAPLQMVLKCWEGLGYYSRARNLHKAADEVVSRHDGQIPRTWDAICALPGVGPYIASAVLSIAYGRPFAVVDGNVKRVLARLLEEPTPVNTSRAYGVFLPQAELLLERSSPGQYNQALMEVGALVCKPSKPDCAPCPIKNYCLGWQRGTVERYPRKQRRKPVPVVPVAVGVVRKSGRVLLTQRKNEGLLGGLWEFPGGKIATNEKSDAACIREIKEEVGLDVKIDRFLVRIRHAYTHFKIVLDVYLCHYLNGDVTLNGPTDYRWITIDEIDHYPLPKANLKFIHIVKKEFICPQVS